MTVSTMSTRASRLSASGMRIGIPAAAILRLARTMRCATASCVLNVARAI